MITRITLVAAMLFCATTKPSNPVTEPCVSRRVFIRKLISPERLLVVTRGPNVAPAMLNGIWGSDAIGRIDAAFDVKAELCAADGTSPLLLWCGLFGEPRDRRMAPIEVVDAAIDNQELVLAIFGAGEIFLERKMIGEAGGKESSAANLRGADWSLLAHAGSIHRDQLEVRLSRSDAGLWAADVTHRLRGDAQHTRFEQVKGEWTFKVTSREGGPRSKTERR